MSPALPAFHVCCFAESAGRPPGDTAAAHSPPTRKRAHTLRQTVQRRRRQPPSAARGSLRRAAPPAARAASPQLTAIQGPPVYRALVAGALFSASKKGLKRDRAPSESSRSHGGSDTEGRAAALHGASPPLCPSSVVPPAGYTREGQAQEQAPRPRPDHGIRAGHVLCRSHSVQSGHAVYNGIMVSSHVVH